MIPSNHSVRASAMFVIPRLILNKMGCLVCGPDKLFDADTESGFNSAVVFSEDPSRELTKVANPELIVRIAGPIN